MKIEFLIPVTDLPGYRRITSYKKHPKLRISSVTVGRTDHKSHKSLTEDFDALIDAQSALALEGFSDGTCYRMVLDEKIVSGESWKVPVALSHAAQYQGISRYFEAQTGLPDGEPEMVVWSTGAYEFDLTLDTQRSYDIEAKLILFRPEALRMITEGKRLVIFLPPHQAELVSSDIGKRLAGLGAEFYVIATLKEGLGILADKVSREAVKDDDTALRREGATSESLVSPKKKSPVALLASLLVLGLAGAGGLYWKDGLAFYEALQAEPPKQASDPAHDPSPEVDMASDDAIKSAEASTDAPPAQKVAEPGPEQPKPSDAPETPEATSEAMPELTADVTPEEEQPKQPEGPKQTEEPVEPEEAEPVETAEVSPFRFYLLKSPEGVSCIKTLINPQSANIEPVDRGEDGQFTAHMEPSVCGIGVASADASAPHQLSRQLPPSLVAATMPPLEFSRQMGDGPEVLLFFKRQARPSGDFEFTPQVQQDGAGTPATITLTLSN